jgi:hypothetical protein
VGCGNNHVQVSKTPSTQPLTDKYHVQISKTSPTLHLLHTETLDVRNCETTKDLHNSLYDFLQAREKVTITEQANAIETGHILDIPKTKWKDLADEVSGAYQQEYKQAQASLQEIEVNVPADMIHMYQIQWIEKTYQGTISFPFDDAWYEVSYTYKLRVPQMDGFRQMSCTA